MALALLFALVVVVVVVVLVVIVVCDWFAMIVSSVCSRIAIQITVVLVNCSRVVTTIQGR